MGTGSFISCKSTVRRCHSGKGQVHGHGTPVVALVASHKLCEVIHRGNEAFPLACLVGGCSLRRGLSWDFGMGWRVHQRQAWVRIVHFFTDPLTETLNVAESCDPLGGIDVRGVGSAVVYL